MAKDKTLTLEDLKSKQNAERSAVIALLQANGFYEKGSNGNWQHSSWDTSRPPLYIPPYDNLNRQVINAVVRAVEAVRPQNHEQGETLPEWAEQILQGHPRFKARKQGSELLVYANDYPEYMFSVGLTGREEDSQNLQEQVAFYESEASREVGLTGYAALLDQVAALGIRREHAAGVTTLIFPIKELPPVVLSGTLNRLSSKVEDARQSLIFKQLEIIEQLSTHGFTKVDHAVADTPEGQGTLTLEHPRLKGAVTIPVHGTDGWLNPEEWGQLQHIIAEAKPPRKPPPTTTPAVPTLQKQTLKPTRISSDQVAPPEAKQAVLVLDSAALVHLCTTRHGSNADWTDLLHETLTLPNVGKIIIPDYIADFEMRGIARRYDEDDNPIEIPPINGEKFHDIRRRFNAFIKYAVRRHINKEGQEEYLLEPNVAPESANTNIIIWETAKGREMEDDICQLANQDKIDEIKRKYWRNRMISNQSANNHAGELDKGEQLIELFANEEMKWDNPAFILSSDQNYIDNRSNQRKTRTGKPKSYASTYAYLNAELAREPDSEELSDRAKYIRNALSLRETDIDTIYERIFLQTTNADYVRPRDIYHAGSHLDDEAETIYALISNGFLAKREQERNVIAAAHPSGIIEQPIDQEKLVVPLAAQITTPSAAAVDEAPLESATLESRQLGGIIGKHMLEIGNYDQVAGQVAAQASRLCDHMPPMTREMVEGICSGKIPIDHDHLYAFLILLVDNNPAVAEEAKQDESRRMIDLYMAHARQIENRDAAQAINAEEYHDFGRFVYQQFEAIGAVGYAAIAEMVGREVPKHLRPLEGTVDGALMREVVKGNHVPSPGLALAIRKTLVRHAPGFEADEATFDQAYFSAKHMMASTSLRPAETHVEQEAEQSDLQTQKQNIADYFEVKDGDGTRKLETLEIAQIAGINSRPVAGVLVGKSPKTAKKFAGQTLDQIGDKWKVWIRDNRPDQIDAFATSFEAFKRAHEAAQQLKK